MGLGICCSVHRAVYTVTCDSNPFMWRACKINSHAQAKEACQTTHHACHHDIDREFILRMANVRTSFWASSVEQAFRPHLGEGGAWMAKN